MEFTLQKWEPSLEPSLAESAKDARISAYMRDSFPYPYTPQSAREFIAFASRQKRDIYYAIAVNGRAVGGIAVALGQDVYAKSAEIGYWLNPAYWGKGIMTAAVRRICAEAFEKRDIARIHAEVFSPNAASVRVLQKCGFVQEGIKKKSVFKRGKYYYRVVMALVKE